MTSSPIRSDPKPPTLTYALEVSTLDEIIGRIRTFISNTNEDYNYRFLCDMSEFHNNCKIQIKTPIDQVPHLYTVLTRCTLTKKLDGTGPRTTCISEEPFKSQLSGKTFDVILNLPFEHDKTATLYYQIQKMAEESSSCTVM